MGVHEKTTKKTVIKKIVQKMHSEEKKYISSSEYLFPLFASYVC